VADADDIDVAVIGGGVVGCAVAHALARRGVAATVLEAEPGLALGASGTNSGILHTGFDSPAGELETRLILRAAELREELLDELGVSVWSCGARLTPHGDAEHATVTRLAANARVNGVRTRLARDGALFVPGESITDPVAFVHALASAAQAGGARIALGARVAELSQLQGDRIAIGLDGGRRLRAKAAVNCAGLYADEIAALAGDLALAGEGPLEVYPRKGEFLVFRTPEPLREILLPVPSELGKGVLVFPSLDGHVIAGPTAREREDKDDWSVEADACELIMARAQRMFPPLARAKPVGAYAGLRPAGRGANYVIERSRALSSLIHVAAIRSTGLSASLAIGEHVAELLAAHAGVQLGPARALPATAPTPTPAGPWWERAAAHHAGRRGEGTST
jgi:glycerol-3-phosphate dehydrogenase